MAKYTITIEIDEDGIKVVPNQSAPRAALTSSAASGTPNNVAPRILSPSYAQSIAAAKGGGGFGDTGPGSGGFGDTGPGTARVPDPGKGGGAGLAAGGGGFGDTGPGTARVPDPGKGGRAGLAAGGGGFGDTGPGSGGFGDTGPGTGVTSHVLSSYGSGGNIGIPLQPQQQVEWCWAAIAVAIDKYFDPSSTLKQCEVANQVFDRSDCCAKAGADACNQAELLQDALTAVGHFRGAVAQALSFDELQAEIDAGRPACARIAWASGGAHFVAIDGYRVLSSGAQHVYVADPLNPPSEVDFDEFTSAYHGEGTWTGTYFVRV